MGNKIIYFRRDSESSKFFDDIQTIYLDDNNASTNSGLDHFFSNMYLVQSSVEQQNSVKYHGNGSPFIQTVCESLSEKWRTDSLMYIFVNDVTETLQEWKPTEGKICNLVPRFRMLGNSTSHTDNSLFSTLASAVPDSRWRSVPAIHPWSKSYSSL